MAIERCDFSVCILGTPLFCGYMTAKLCDLDFGITDVDAADLIVLDDPSAINSENDWFELGKHAGWDFPIISTVIVDRLTCQVVPTGWDDVVAVVDAHFTEWASKQ